VADLRPPQLNISTTTEPIQACDTALESLLQTELICYLDELPIFCSCEVRGQKQKKTTIFEQIYFTVYPIKRDCIWTGKFQDTTILALGKGYQMSYTTCLYE